MSARETLSRMPIRAAMFVAAVVVLVVVGVFAFQRSGAPTSGGASSEVGKLFFTSDDGKTWFADEMTKIPPFDKDGKQAVIAHVYRSTNGRTFVNHLERFTPDAKRALEKAQVSDPTGKTRPDQIAIQNAYTAGRQFKRPGEANWVNAANFKDAAQVTSVRCPDGANAATPVEP
jgi:hypothetical protein